MHLPQLNHTYLLVCLQIWVMPAQISKNFRGKPNWIRSIEHFHSVSSSPAMSGTLATAGSLVNKVGSEKTPFNQTQMRQVPPSVLVSQQENLTLVIACWSFRNFAILVIYKFASFWYFWWRSRVGTLLDPQKLVFNPQDFGGIHSLTHLKLLSWGMKKVGL